MTKEAPELTGKGPNKDQVMGTVDLKKLEQDFQIHMHAPGVDDPREEVAEEGPKQTTKLSAKQQKLLNAHNKREGLAAQGRALQENTALHIDNLIESKRRKEKKKAEEKERGSLGQAKTETTDVETNSETDLEIDPGTADGDMPVSLEELENRLRSISTAADLTVTKGEIARVGILTENGKRRPVNFDSAEGKIFSEEIDKAFSNLKTKDPWSEAAKDLASSKADLLKKEENDQNKKKKTAKKGKNEKAYEIEEDAADELTWKGRDADNELAVDENGLTQKKAKIWQAPPQPKREPELVQPKTQQEEVQKPVPRPKAVVINYGEMPKLRPFPAGNPDSWGYVEFAVEEPGFITYLENCAKIDGMDYAEMIGHPRDSGNTEQIALRYAAYYEMRSLTPEIEKMWKEDFAKDFGENSKITTSTHGYIKMYLQENSIENPEQIIHWGQQMRLYNAIPENLSQVERELEEQLKIMRQNSIDPAPKEAAMRHKKNRVNQLHERMGDLPYYDFDPSNAPKPEKAGFFARRKEARSLVKQGHGEKGFAAVFGRFFNPNKHIQMGIEKLKDEIELDREFLFRQTIISDEGERARHKIEQKREELKQYSGELKRWLFGEFQFGGEIKEQVVEILKEKIEAAGAGKKNAARETEESLAIIAAMEAKRAQSNRTFDYLDEIETGDMREKLDALIRVAFEGDLNKALDNVKPEPQAYTKFERMLAKWVGGRETKFGSYSGDDAKNLIFEILADKKEQLRTSGRGVDAKMILISNLERRLRGERLPSDHTFQHGPTPPRPVFSSSQSWI